MKLLSVNRWPGSVKIARLTDHRLLSLTSRTNPSVKMLVQKFAQDTPISLQNPIFERLDISIRIMTAKSALAMYKLLYFP